MLANQPHACGCNQAVPGLVWLGAVRQWQAMAAAHFCKLHKLYWLLQDGSTASLSLLLAANPSHLEAVTPVVLGMVRSAQQQLHEGSQPPGAPPCSSKAAAIVVHGDAAFAGLGLAAECLQLSNLPGKPSMAARTKKSRALQHCHVPMHNISAEATSAGCVSAAVGACAAMQRWSTEVLSCRLHHGWRDSCGDQ